jgi:hypothetical protein
VVSIVDSNGVLTQFEASGVPVIPGHYRSASVAFGPSGRVTFQVTKNGTLIQFDKFGAHKVGKVF